MEFERSIFKFHERILKYNRIRPCLIATSFLIFIIFIVSIVNTILMHFTYVNKYTQMENLILN